MTTLKSEFTNSKFKPCISSSIWIIEPHLSPIPYWKEIMCAPAVYDSIPGSSATQSPMNSNTRYYTIAGNWYPDPYYSFIFPLDDSSCNQPSWLPFERWGTFVIWGPDDGIVPLASTTPVGFINIGVTHNCHTNLFGAEEYNKVKNELLAHKWTYYY